MGFNSGFKGLNVSGLAATVRFEKSSFSYAGSPVRLVQLVLCNASARNSTFDRSKYRAVSYSEKTTSVGLMLKVYFYCPSHSIQIFIAQRRRAISAPVFYLLYDMIYLTLRRLMSYIYIYIYIYIWSTYS